MEDEMLIKRIINKDKEAFKELYDRYGDYALRVALAITKDSNIALDAVQETFIRVYFNIGSFKLGHAFKPWLYKILVNECNRILKQKGSISYISDYVENHQSFAQEDEYNFQEYEDLYQAVNELNDINRIPLILKYLGNFKESEIAEILNININTLKSRLYKGRQKLKKKLGKKYERRNTNGR